MAELNTINTTISAVTFGSAPVLVYDYAGLKVTISIGGRSVPDILEIRQSNLEKTRKTYHSHLRRSSLMSGKYISKTAGRRSVATRTSYSHPEAS